VLYEHRGVSCYAFTLWGRVDRSNGTVLPDPPREAFATASRDSRETFAAGEREGGRASEGESAGECERESETLSARMSREVLPPDPFCPDHPGGVLEPCIACQNARLRNKHFLDIRRWEMRQGDPDEPF
jgi:hypothetical protein